LEKNATEVINMLMTEWNWDDALAVRYEEGMEEGMEKGQENERGKIARNALAEGIPIEQIRKITGLDDKTIEKLMNNQQ
jgi:predicted transposase/invertase (TIGR01784 family)